MSSLTSSSSSFAAESMARPRCHPSFSFAVTTLSLFMLPLRNLSSSSAIASAFSQIAPAAAAFSSFAYAFLASLSACAAALCLWWRFFKNYFLNDLLFFELKLHGFNVLCCLFTLIMFNRVVLSCILDVDVLLKHVDRESSHDTSVVASHVDHVIGLSFVSEVFSCTSC